MESASACSCCLLLLIAFLLYLAKCYIAASARSGGGNGGTGGLRLPPGPRQLPVIGSLHHMALAGAVLPHRALRSLARRYGSLMLLRFGEVPVVVASSRDAAREVLRTRDAALATRHQSTTVRTLTGQGQAVALTPHGDHWRQLRRICVQELLCAARVRSFRRVREEEAARLVAAVTASTTAGAALVNLSELSTAYVADATVRAVTGRRLDARDALQLLRFVDEGVRLAAGGSLADLFPSSWLAGALSRRHVRRTEAYREGLFRFLDGVVNEHMERRRRKPHDQQEFQEDLIDVLLRIQSQGSCPHLTMDTLKAVIFDLFSAGTETAATTLVWAMAELMRNPHVMARAQAEVRLAFKPLKKVAEEGLSKLSYLHWVVKETLRLHCPGPLLIPRECMETCNILGYDVPKGAMVLVNAWTISRDPECWEEPEEFKPERFETDTRDFRGTDFDFTPFGAGRRMCPGMSFGLSNLELALANLLFYFDWSLPEHIRPSEMDMTETMGMTARRKRELLLRATIV